jgi:hypothetical protein
VRCLAREQLVEHAAETVDVAPGIEAPLAGGLLRAHVLRRADEEAGLREAVGRRGAGGERDPEVGDHRLPLVEEYVLRLDVPMDQRVAVGMVERGGDLPGDLDRLAHREPPLGPQPLPQRAAPYPRHHVEEPAGGLARVVERQDVRVIERGGDPDLAGEAVGAEDGAELGAEHLHRDLPVVAQVVGEIHGRHAAAAELAADGVALCERVGHPR